VYFRGLRVLIGEEKKRTAGATTANELTGFGEYRWDSWLWRGVYFLVAIVIALVGDSAPVDILSARLFWVHMVQHLFLLVIIAPLLVAAAPLQPLWLGLPGWARRFVEGAGKLKAGHVSYRVGHRVGYWLRQPVVACILLIVGV